MGGYDDVLGNLAPQLGALIVAFAVWRWRTTVTLVISAVLAASE